MLVSQNSDNGLRPTTDPMTSVTVTVAVMTATTVWLLLVVAHVVGGVSGECAAAGRSIARWSIKHMPLALRAGPLATQPSCSCKGCYWQQRGQVNPTSASQPRHAHVSAHLACALRGFVRQTACTRRLGRLRQATKSHLGAFFGVIWNGVHEHDDASRHSRRVAALFSLRMLLSEATRCDASRTREVKELVDRGDRLGGHEKSTSGGICVCARELEKE